MSDLIIYFSRAGENYFGGELKDVDKGNTEVIAEYIREFTGADVFRVRELNEYPHEYIKCTEVAKKEFESGARPDLKECLEDISQYDTIYVGFPNWWGTMPMVMFTQLEKLDFNGKTVKPFVTHEGSEFGNSIKDLNKICTGAEIKKGLSVPGTGVHEAKNKVEIWVGE